MTKMNFNIPFGFKKIADGQEVHLMLYWDVLDRREYLSFTLDEFNMYFGDDLNLFDSTTDEHVAVLITNQDLLSCWLNNDSDNC